VGIVDDIRTCVTSDLKTEGNLMYLVGKQTEKELGGSEYNKVMKVDGGVVPKTNPEVLTCCMKGLPSCMKKGYVAACHDVSEGGLAVCLAEMAIGGDIGALIDVSEIGEGLRTDVKLFSESNTRWVVEVKKGKQNECEKLLKKNKVPYLLLGKVTGNRLVVQDDKKTVIDLPVEMLRKWWRTPIWDFMG
jgi:phosphoribosylformylglycinamidine synthase